MTLSPLDLVIVLAYVAFVAVLGGVLGGKQKDASDYFLADHAIPWWAACFSVVATETSALSFISVPAGACRTEPRGAPARLPTAAGAPPLSPRQPGPPAPR